MNREKEKPNGGETVGRRQNAAGAIVIDNDSTAPAECQPPRFKVGDIVIGMSADKVKQTLPLPIIAVGGEEGEYHYKLDDPTTNTYYPEEDLQYVPPVEELFGFVLDAVVEDDDDTAALWGAAVASALELLDESDRLEVMTVIRARAATHTHGATACLLCSIPTPEARDPVDSVTAGVAAELMAQLDAATGPERDELILTLLGQVALMSPVTAERYRGLLLAHGVRAPFIDAELKARRADNELEPPAAVATTKPRAPGGPLSHFLSESADDEGNAQCILAQYPGWFAHCKAFGWLNHNGRYWQRDGAEAALDRATRATLKARRHAAVSADREAIIKATSGRAYNVKNAKYMFRSMVTVSTDEFDADPAVLNCQNGVLDLRTGKLVTHEPAQRFTYCLPVAYEPEADQSAWLAFLNEATERKVITKYLQACLGYSLTGFIREEIMFYIFGPPRSGKGTYTETVLAMLGREPLATEVDFGTFTRRRDNDSQNFDLAPLKPCRFVAASESSRAQRLNAEHVKTLTGGNLIRCAHKYREHFAYRPQFKIWLTSNWPVNADPDDDALWSRLRVIRFPTSHLGKEDKSLKWRLRQPEQLAGVLAWCVEGAQRWFKAGSSGLVTPHQVTSDTEQVRTELDYVAQWLDECIEKTGNADHFLANEALYQSYKAWCDASGVPPKKQRGLTVSMKRKGYNAGIQKKDASGNRRGCTGVQFTTAPVII